MTDQPMTVDELLAWARRLISANQRAYVEKTLLDVAYSIVHLLGVGHPCGYPKPEIHVGASGEVYLEIKGEREVSSEEGRGLVASVLRACDEAERAGRVTEKARDAQRAERAATPDLDRAAEALVFALYIYGGYRLNSRGPIGCILKALDVIAPPIAAELREGDASDVYRSHWGDDAEDAREADR